MIFLILTVLYTQARMPLEERNITLGHTLGIACLTMISLVGAFGTRLLPMQYVRLLGLVPILLGLRTLINHWRLHESDDIPSDTVYTGCISTAAVTIANGADNIGVYVPLFADFSPVQLLTAFVVFFLMNLLWCHLGKHVSDLPIIRNVVRRYKEIVMGSVFILIGLYILIK